MMIMMLITITFINKIIYIILIGKNGLKYFGDESMLETPYERIKLLKEGLTGKRIEELYISHNKIKILHIPVLYTQVEIKD